MGSRLLSLVAAILCVFAAQAILAPSLPASQADAAARSTAHAGGVEGALAQLSDRWLGTDKTPLPFVSDAEIGDFLLEADVLSMEEIPAGTTKPRKVLLERDGVRANAIFRDVDVFLERVWLDNGSFHMRLRDYAGFEVAAYRMALLLGLDNVPPAVLRRVDGDLGSLQLWVENAVTEDGRREGALELPNRAAWIRQLQAMFLFDFVIGNVDRNTGNYLTDSRGKLWMIDHTRAFQMFLSEWTPEQIGVVERDLWERLKILDGETLREKIGDVLSPFEIDQLEERLASLVAHIHDQIATRGERDVIIDYESAPAGSP